jgi:hypothetical protein
MKWILLPAVPLLLLDGIDARSKGVVRPTLAVVAPAGRPHLPQVSLQELAGVKRRKPESQPRGGLVRQRELESGNVINRINAIGTRG